MCLLSDSSRSNEILERLKKIDSQFDLLKQKAELLISDRKEVIEKTAKIVLDNKSILQQIIAKTQKGNEITFEEESFRDFESIINLSSYISIPECPGFSNNRIMCESAPGGETRDSQHQGPAYNFEDNLTEEKFLNLPNKIRSNVKYAQLKKFFQQLLIFANKSVDKGSNMKSGLICSIPDFVADIELKWTERVLDTYINTLKQLGLLVTLPNKRIQLLC